ncbi:endoglucanase E-4-like [Mercenaria mercenaria]|uniref:endoglucanase E-4-like n=1 Tax=Mercenaria mercenaria TaxID=6596 RepID=UPI00234F373E|nr:endoglucanase E-4-like [Mercenaria mercenaria]
MKLVVMVCCISYVLATPLKINSVWAGGCEGQFIVQANQNVHGWRATLHFNRPISVLKPTLARVVSHNSTVWTVEGWATIAEHVTLHVVFVCFYSGNQAPSGTYRIEGSNTDMQVLSTALPVDKNSIFQVSATKYNYSEALGLSILFYEAQRSGKLPANNRIPWRGDSALNDSDNGHDLTGGWYDAGDHVKFNMPMAFSTWVLGWGMLKFKVGYEAAGQLDMACDMLKWPLEYFLKCWVPNENTLYVQVGDLEKDHRYWGRAENMNMSRPVYKVTPSCAGSDVGGATVSSLAAGYLVFKDVCPDIQFANRLLSAANSLYTFTFNNRGIYTRCVKNSAQSYLSSQERDEVAVASAWMYKATGEDKYLKNAKDLYPAGRPWSFDWNNEQTGAALLLYEATQDPIYKGEIETMLRYYLPGGGALYTPCGLMWQMEWGTNRYAANTAFIALMAAEEGIYSDTYKRWAISQINYLLGDNKLKISYEIGFGDVYPLHPHHRGSACPTNVDWCLEDASGPNPNLLQGALVGGPDQWDNYADRRGDARANEVACDYNAGFQSALAGLLHFAQNGSLPAAPDAKC